MVKDNYINSIGSSLCLWNSQHLLVGLGNNIGVIDLSALDENEEENQRNERPIFRDDNSEKENKLYKLKIVKKLPCDSNIKIIKKIEEKNYIISQTLEENILLWK